MQKTILIAFALLVLPGTNYSHAHASPQLEIDDLFNQAIGPESEDPEFDYSLQANKLAAGAHAVLTITVRLPAGRYTYAMQDENAKTQVRFATVNGLEPTSDFVPAREPKITVDKILGWKSQKYYNEITWTRHYRITDPADAKLGGTITGSFCSETSDGGGSCLPFSDEFALNVAVAQDTLPAPPVVEATRPFAVEIIPTRKSRGQQKPDPLKLQIALTPENAAAGDEVTLSIHMELNKGWHTFSLDQNPANAGLPTEIDVTPNGLIPLGEKFTADREPHRTTVETFEIVEQLTFENDVTWTRKFRVAEGVAAGGYGADGSIQYQVCRESCLPPKGVKFGLGAEVIADSTSATTDPKSDAKTSDVLAADTPEQLAEMAALYNADTAINFVTLGETVATTLWTAIFGAFVGGIILNLMPCVFPVLGLKVMGFVQLAGNDAKKIRLHGIAFTAGLVVSMWCLAGGILFIKLSLGREVNWGQQMGDPYFVGGIIILLFVLGLNMAGVFEMGTSMTRVGGNLTQKKGYTQSFFSGILTTLIATPCSGPFLGAAMGYTLAQPPTIAMFLFTVFALGIALPYLLLSFFPSLINKLPRPGAWMETFKVTMAFALFATAAFFMQTYGGQTGVSGMSWMIMALVVIGLACYFYGQWTLPHLKFSTRLWKGFFLPSVVAGVGLWMAYGSAGYEAPEATHAERQQWRPGKIEYLTAKKKRIVWVDYTADW
jgi:thiol:disulfide interchange protein